MAVARKKTNTKKKQAGRPRSARTSRKKSKSTHPLLAGIGIGIGISLLLGGLYYVLNGIYSFEIPFPFSEQPRTAVSAEEPPAHAGALTEGENRYEPALDEMSSHEIPSPETSSPETPSPEVPLPDESTIAAVPSQPSDARPEPDRRVPPPAPEGKIFVVIDDVGQQIMQLDPFLQIGVPLNFAVLPHLPDSTQSAILIAEAGMEVILHLPMQPLGLNNPGPGAILVDFDEQQIIDMLDHNIAAVPHITGVNNHMGSKATGDMRVMSILFSQLEKRELYFLDSRTTHLTVGDKVAARHTIPYLSRTLFLDHEPTEEYIRTALRKGIAIAKEGQSAILIGHVTVPLLAQILAEEAQSIEDSGVQFAFLSTHS